MDHRIIDQVIIINDEVQRALPVGEFNKQLRKREERLAYWRFCTIASLAAQWLPVACWDRRDQIAGKTLLLIVAFVQRKPPEIVLPAAH